MVRRKIEDRIDNVMESLNLINAEEQNARRIMREKRTSLEDKKYVLFNIAFGMAFQSSLCDGDRELLGTYLDKISIRTIQRHYSEFMKNGYLQMEKIYESARRIYNKKN